MGVQIKSTQVLPSKGKLLGLPTNIRPGLGQGVRDEEKMFLHWAQGLFTSLLLTLPENIRLARMHSTVSNALAYFLKVFKHFSES